MERQWRAATGLDEKQFRRWLKHFDTAYQSLYGQTVAARQAPIEVSPSLTSEKELLYFTLFSLKAGLRWSSKRGHESLGRRVSEISCGCQEFIKSNL